MAPARRRAAAKNGVAAKETEVPAPESTTRASRQAAAGRGQRRTQKSGGRGQAEPESETLAEPEEQAEEEEGEEGEEEAADRVEEEATAEATTGQGDRPVVLSFSEPLSWRPGKPIATEELIRRLDALSRELSDLDQETFDAESLTKVSKELANHNLLNHKDKGVKAFAAACLVDILCLCAPNAPFTQTQLQDVFGLFIYSILPALQDPSNTYDAQHKYVLHSLSEVRSIVLLNDLDNSDALQLQLFSSLFDAVSAPKNVTGGRLPTDVEHDISDILICLIEEGSSVPPKVVDVIMAQFLRAAAPGVLREKGVPDKEELDRYQSTLLLKEEPPAYQIAKLICLTCADKMTRSVAQYFSDVIIDFSGVGGGNGGPGAGGNRANGHKGGKESDEEAEEDEGLNGPSDADLREMRKAHLLLRELWRAAPQVLSNVVPQLEAELSADNVYLRKLASETLGDMISGIGAAGPPAPPTLDPAAYPAPRLSDEPTARASDSVLTTPTSPHSFAQTHAHIYQSFINRKNDKSGLIRTAWVTAAGYILSTSAGGIGLSREEETALVLGLGDKLNDSDEKVRLAAVKAIECFSFRDVMTKLAPHGGVSKEGSVLANLADRGRDRKSHVRVEAMALLGKLWAAATGELAAGDEAVTTALGAVPSRIFNAIYANDLELNLLVDRIAYEYLVPLSYPAVKKAAKAANGRSHQQKAAVSSASGSGVDGDALRAERILLLVRSLDAGAKRAFFALQSRQPQFSRIVDGFLKQCEAYNGGVGEDGRKAGPGLEKSMQYLAQFFPDGPKVKADLQKFARLNDRRSYQLIRFVTGPEHDFTTMYRAMKELVKKLQAVGAGGVLDTLLPLLYRSGCIMFNRSHLTTILECSKGGQAELAATANEMLKEVSQRNPGLFKTTIGELCKELTTQAPTETRENDPVVMDSLKACASYAAKYPQEVPRERTFAQAWISFALYGRPEKAAKYAVNILLATRDETSMVSATELAQKATCDLGFDGPRFLNKLVTLSQLARLAPAVIADTEDDVRKLVMDTLRNVRTAASAGDPAWASDAELDEEGRAKVLCLRFLVQQLLGTEDGEEAKKDGRHILRLLIRFVAKDGEASRTGETPAHHRARLRLAAAQAVLKICANRQFDELLSPADFNALALTTQDPAPEVRHGFIEKLQKYLVLGRLRPRFYTIVFLAAFEPNAEFRHQVETWIRSRARHFQQARQAVMEGLVARLISLLAHHPDFTTEPDEQVDHARYVLFYLSNVATEANLGLINKYAERVKQTLDGIDAGCSENLYLLSDLTQATIRRFQQRKGWVLEPHADKVGVPQGLYAPLPSHEVALEIARKQYVPEGVEDQIDDLLKATERKKKRKSTDEYHLLHDATQQAAKRAKTSRPSQPRVERTTTGSGPKKSSTSSSRTPRPKKTAKPTTTPTRTIPDSERRRSGRSGRAQQSYIERDSDEDDDEMLDGVAEWEYLRGSDDEDDSRRGTEDGRRGRGGNRSLPSRSRQPCEEAMAPKPAHLAPSELGTKEYWDSLYATELANHAGNPADTGTVWFDDVDAETRMVSYLGDFLEADADGSSDGSASRPSLRVIDLGCGNGSLLRAVRDELAERTIVAGEVCLLGVDYSAASIVLARQVTADTNDTDDTDDTDDTMRPAIALAEWDVLRGDADALGLPAGSWDVVLDKGTFDAVSLGHGLADADTTSTQDTDTVESLYLGQVLRLLRPGGRFLVTSCNWTEAELDAWMTAPGPDPTAGRLARVGRIAYPTFRFGGAQGQAVCTSCFQKRV
ncbi:sister chromatid cohesion and DNA repair protein [Grosmannia clavigera kw1407]|uniref:Protein-lysine N-methyltransferase EFM4 n=1 Tax=Grosmannia clavigera (strain kw1407 / UAMH 11150) TaxID=655863 RepID=F0XPY0_GROCL|nr:sister chromatid cohesion and DNA repair protein [Grosmannia clavigera kw1407]EFX00091.1 sister chromatid cohesion and DNA repair protein [Grosmannia clavigera kw1407]